MIDNTLIYLFTLELDDNPVWTTQDGRKVKISKMSDRHLLNTIRYLEKRQAMLKNIQADIVDEESFIDLDVITYPDIYYNMKEVVKKRGLIK